MGFIKLYILEPKNIGFIMLVNTFSLKILDLLSC